MPTDKVTKVLLATIAFALLMVAANPWLRPMPVAAQQPMPTLIPLVSQDNAEFHLRQMSSHLRQMSSHVNQIQSNVRSIYNGGCLNSKIC
jgi:hypothetical protein